MAAVAIPLVASAVSALVPLIPGIIKGLEGLFGPKTGDAKMAAAVNMVTEAAKALATAGKIPGVPDASAITALIESKVQELKAQGQLPAPTEAPSPFTPSGALVFDGATVIILRRQ
jgi:hypothetical protein